MFGCLALTIVTEPNQKSCMQVCTDKFEYWRIKEDFINPCCFGECDMRKRVSQVDIVSSSLNNATAVALAQLPMKFDS